ncbi:MAG: intermembrane transport protein PqiB, partial [Burkholderiaceae bacterium]
WIAVNYVLSQGPTITITFTNAEGLEAGKTKVRYKNVDIGTVKDIAISKDRSHVVVTADIVKNAENLIVADTRFWVVRPHISFNSVTGIGTLLSGAYIGVDAGRSDEAKRAFDGLETPPRVTSDFPGREFTLHAENIGSLYVGAPVYFRRVPVGEVTGYHLDADGKGVAVDIFVTSPHDKLVTANSRFWHASGIDFSLEGSGVKLNTESLISIVVGGISFQPAPNSEPAPPAPANTVFTLFQSKEAALKPDEKEVQTYLLYFTESLRGLSPGAQVDFRGINIGEVKAVSVEYDRETKTLRFPVEIDIYPARLRSRYRKGATQMSAMEREPRVLLERWVKRGFRAQLKTANLITGQLFVALDFFPHAPPAQIDWSQSPVVLPTIPGALENIQETLGNIARKLDNVPFESIGKNVNQTLQSLNRTLQSADKVVRQLDGSVLPEMRDTLAAARGALDNAQRTLSADAPVQQDLRDTLSEVSRAAQALRVLADYLSRHPEALIRGKRGEE